MTGADDDTAVHATRIRRIPVWLWMLGLLAAILTTAQALGVAYMGSGWSAPRGSIGIAELANCGTDRFCVAASVRPDSPAANAGIEPGDRLRLDRYWERRRTLAPGDHVGITVRRSTALRHVELVAGPRPYYAPSWIVDGMASAAVCLIALTILARAGRRGWPFLLGCSLVSLGIPGGYPRFWQNAPALFPWFFLGLAVAYMAGPVLMLAALRGFRRDVTGRVPRWLDRLLGPAAVVVAIATAWGTAVELDSTPIFGLGNGLLLTSLTWSLGSLLGPLALAAGWHRVPSESRTRYAFMWVAVSVASIRPAVDPVIIATGNNYGDLSWPVIVQLGSTILAAWLFAYAILRAHVIDLGFAVSRTLVFSALSFLTLVVFGLVEWISERLLPLESLEASAVIEAGVALTLFLMFHHIHAWIERLVERVFFHRWHANEAALRAFMHQARFVSGADALIARTIEELRRFGGGAPVGFYRPAPGGYALVAGGRAGPDVLDADAQALVAMRADRAVVRNAFADGDIALPMMLRAELTSIIVLGPKPNCDPYRADEEVLFAEVADRVGLDLYALQVDALQDANARLATALAMLAARLPDRPPTGTPSGG